MNLWKPASRKSKKVNSSGSEEVPWSGHLPDVVADLSLAEAAGPHAPSAMLGARDHHYIDMGEARARRREARPPPPPVTPQGLGATPQGLGAAPSVVLAGGSVGTNGGGWRHNPSHNPWPSSQLPVEQGLMTANVSGSGLGVCGGGGGVEGEGARVRSISSDGRGPPGSGGDRRVRCSSATRSRQHRPRPPPGGDRIPGTVLPPAGGGHSVQPSFSPSAASGQTIGAGVGVVGGVMARLAGCHEGVESGRDPGEGSGGAYGYQVRDLEALLTRASPSRPANLPMVLASATRLHNMRRTPEPGAHSQQPPVRPFLPLGIIVNAVFKTRDWLYVRTAHGAEGYVPYRVCLPLGILPPPREGAGAPPVAVDATPGGAWESHSADMFQGAMSQFAAASGTQTGALVGVGPESGAQTRGRSRGRRRAPCVDSSNQTDTQKLQPGARSASESRPPRETLDAPPAAVSTTTPTTDDVLV